MAPYWNLFIAFSPKYPITNPVFLNPKLYFRGNYGSDPPRYDPRSTDQLLKHQNSADKILSSHHSVTDNTYSSRNGYSSNRYGYD